jgi:hypothetical protein
VRAQVSQLPEAKPIQLTKAARQNSGVHPRDENPRLGFGGSGWAVGCGLWAVGGELTVNVVDHHLWAVGCQLQKDGRFQPAGDLGLPIADFRSSPPIGAATEGAIPDPRRTMEPKRCRK